MHLLLVTRRPPPLCVSVPPCVHSFLDGHMLALMCLNLLKYMQTLDFALSFLFCSRGSVPLRINLNALFWELNFGDIHIVFLIKKMLSVTIFV